MVQTILLVNGLSKGTFPCLNQISMKNINLAHKTIEYTNPFVVLFIKRIICPVNDIQTVRNNKLKMCIVNLSIKTIADD